VAVYAEPDGERKLLDRLRLKRERARTAAERDAEQLRERRRLWLSVRVEQDPIEPPEDFRRDLLPGPSAEAQQIMREWAAGDRGQLEAQTRDAAVEVGARLGLVFCAGERDGVDRVAGVLLACA
jgi:hypothetical protein